MDSTVAVTYHHRGACEQRERSDSIPMSRVALGGSGTHALGNAALKGVAGS